MGKFMKIDLKVKFEIYNFAKLLAIIVFFVISI